MGSQRSDSAAWLKTRHWYAPPLSPLLARAAAGGDQGMCHMQCSLSRPVVMPLLGNTAGAGTPIVPPAALMMLVAAALDAAAGGQSADGSVLLTDVAVCALALPGADPSLWVLDCMLDASSGSARVLGAAEPMQAPTVLMLTANAAVLAPSASVSSSRGGGAPLWLRQLLRQAAAGRTRPAPQPGIKGQVRRPLPAVEPAVSAVCQLEATLQLQLLAPAAGQQALAATIQACTLQPRGRGAGADDASGD
jgi:hypothetical protein